MRLIAVCLAVLLLFGCTAETPAATAAPAAGNASPNASAAPANASAAANASPAPANASAPAGTAPEKSVTANISSTVVGESNGTDGTSTTETNATAMVFGRGKYLLVLDDISTPSAGSCALLSVWYASGQRITKLSVCPGQDQMWTGPEGESFRIRVLETAAGYTKKENWASIIIYG